MLLKTLASSMKASQIRSAFIDFFAAKQHRVLPGSSLIPANDPTLLFTNSGMVQFKEVFLGNQQTDYQCATTVQPSVRAGGKHNDLENVGFTSRHHTFFEMLGNFSFGAYFKKEAISYAWEFLTQVLKLPQEKLWVTVHYKDKESEDIWFNQIKIDPSRFSRLDEDNFWQMGDTGPCGPCTEIFYDHGADVLGGPPGSPDADGDRFVEIWNLVFMQYNKNAQGELHQLPRPAVDTGMGLERVAAVLQGVHSNYEIDVFIDLLQSLQNLIQQATGNIPDLHSPHMHVIADHLRSSCFLIADQVFPGNEGRAYVLRRIIRRAVRHGYQLGLNQPFIYHLVDTLIKVMGSAYPQLSGQAERIKKSLQQEEQQFFVTLNNGMQLLENYIATHKLAAGDKIPGEMIFKLYDTYGFPVDITSDIAKERQLTLDISGFDQYMAKQKDQARSKQKFRQNQQFPLHDYPETVFVGYDALNHHSQIIGLFSQPQTLQESSLVNQLKQGEEGTVLLASTPFYGESGGQVGDTGKITNKAGACFEVKETSKQGNYHLHHGTMILGQLNLQEACYAQTEQAERQATARNHSATHLLHAALRKILGDHVQQKGSLVNSHYLRFDFAHAQPLTAEQIQQINKLVNQQIEKNTLVQTELMSLDQAKKQGAMALFGEKYGDDVRVLTMGIDEKQQIFSTELCGGTHVKQTGDILLFYITKETGIASGIRRIEALTGATAYQYFSEQLQYLDQLSQQCKTSADKIAERIEQLLQQNKQQQKQLEDLQRHITKKNYQQLISQAEDVGQGIKLLIYQDNSLDTQTARELIDQLKNNFEKAVICLVSCTDNKPKFLVGVTKNLTDKIHAGKLVQHLANQMDGKGGGRADFAQGGGNDASKLEQALAGVKAWIYLQ